jgi:hypothetical protein
MKRLIHLCNNGVMGYLESGSAIKVSLASLLCFLFYAMHHFGAPPWSNVVP